MLASLPLASRALAATPRSPRAFTVSALTGEYGWAAWSFSRQAKLNAWAWHGVGELESLVNVATLGNAIYMRSEADDFVYLMQPDVFLLDGQENAESETVEATTQWLDFGKPGKMKALEGMDFDVLGITSVEVYVFVPNPADPRDRTGTLAATIALEDADSGWTYNGEVISTEDVGSATEFQLRFIAGADREAQINRITLYYSDVAG